MTSVEQVAWIVGQATMWELEKLYAKQLCKLLAPKCRDRKMEISMQI